MASGGHRISIQEGKTPEWERVPRPTTQFRRRAWLDFQRALDPLARPKPLPRLRQH